jgi:CheY-like chemotaxis protein
MSRIVLVHWKEKEARQRAAQLRQTGHRVATHTDQQAGGVGLRDYRRKPPDAFVIDLSRLPSHGTAVATFLRQQKATRPLPLVFVDGAPEKVARVRKLFPDAVYTDWGRFRSALRRALKNPPKQPVVPGTMAGYSGTPLPKKLGIKPGTVVALVGAPKGFGKTLGTLPEGARLQNGPGGRPDLILLFCRSQAEMKKQFPVAARTLADPGKVWIAWPKKASGVATDLDGNQVRRYGLSQHFVDYKICAIDETWSGLLFARRRSKK